MDMKYVYRCEKCGRDFFNKDDCLNHELVCNFNSNDDTYIGYSNEEFDNLAKAYAEAELNGMM